MQLTGLAPWALTGRSNPSSGQVPTPAPRSDQALRLLGPLVIPLASGPSADTISAALAPARQKPTDTPPARIHRENEDPYNAGPRKGPTG